jgi:hypothetical protein
VHEHLVAQFVLAKTKCLWPPADLAPSAALIETLQAHTPAELQVQMVKMEVVPRCPLDLAHQGTTDSGAAILRRGLYAQHSGLVRGQHVRVSHKYQPAGQRLIDSCEEDAVEDGV